MNESNSSRFLDVHYLFNIEGGKKEREREPLFIVWYPWETMKQCVQSLHRTLIIKVLSKGKAEAVWTGDYLAEQKWSGKGQKMATLEDRRSLRKCSFLSRALKHGTREVPSRIWLKVSEQLSLWILSNQEHGWNTRFSSSFSLACGGVTIVEQERGGVSWPHTSHKGSWLSSSLPGGPRLFPLDSGLMDVTLVGGLHTPLSLLNLNDTVAIPQFPALKTNLERGVVILVKMVEVPNHGKGLKSKGEKWLTEEKKTSRPWFSLLHWLSESCDLCSASPCCCLTGCSAENRTKKCEIYS